MNNALMSTNKPEAPKTCQTLDDIAQRKAELRDAIGTEGQQLNKMWKQLTSSRKQERTRGELIASMISYGVTAYDTVMTIRKLKRDYSGIFDLFRKK